MQEACRLAACKFQSKTAGRLRLVPGLLIMALAHVRGRPFSHAAYAAKKHTGR